MFGYIYEVKMQVHSQVYQWYLPWLKKHMAEMLELGCFSKVELHEEQKESEDSHLLRALYHYEKPEDFTHYLEHHAEKMRGDLSVDIKNQIVFTRTQYKKL